jgi:hypothetical protein
VPTLIVDNVPPDIYERLRQRAAAERRSVPEQTLHLLVESLRECRPPSPRLPELIATEESAAPCDLPRTSRPAPVPVRSGRPRLPDPLPGEGPE